MRCGEFTKPQEVQVGKSSRGKDQDGHAIQSITGEEGVVFLPHYFALQEILLKQHIWELSGQRSGKAGYMFNPNGQGVQEVLMGWYKDREREREYIIALWVFGMAI